MKEQSEWLTNIYDAFKGTIITEFRFFDDAIVDASLYTITIDVTEDCKKGPFVNENIEGLTGDL